MSTAEEPKRGAYESAVRLLGVREHSRYELSEKLLFRGYSVSQVEEALNLLIDQGYVDDSRFAEILMRQYTDLGRQGLADQMRKRGIDPQIWTPLVDSIDDEQESARARALLLRKAPPFPADFTGQQKWRRRVAGLLMRRGFTQHCAMAAIRRVAGEQGESSGN